MKKGKNYLLVTQVYVDDIVFRATIDACAIEFSEEMKKEFEMSMVGDHRCRYHSLKLMCAVCFTYLSSIVLN